MSKRAVFFFASPVIQDGERYYFGDNCYYHTVALCQPPIEEALLVARVRQAREVSGRLRLDAVGARLAVDLPDFGIAGAWSSYSAARFYISDHTLNQLSDLISGAALVYADGPSPEAWLAARATRRAKQRLVFEMRGEPLPLGYLRRRFGVLGIAYACASIWMWNYVRRVAAAGLYVSPFLMERYPVRGDHCAAVSDVRLPFKAIPGPREFTAPARRYLFVGSIELIKRLDILLQALQLVRENLPRHWTLDIIGDGPDLGRLSRLCQDLRLSDRIVFRGRVPHGRELFRYYEQSDLFLNCSTTEAGPRAVAEAMAFGLPVLSPPVGAVPDWLDSAALVRPTSPRAFAKAILRVVFRASVLTEWSQRNWARAQEFDPLRLEARRRRFFEEEIAAGSQQCESDWLQHT